MELLFNYKLTEVILRMIHKYYFLSYSQNVYIQEKA